MRVLKVLLEITVYSWILFAAILLLKKIIRKRSSPTLQYLVWFLFMARLCIPITFDSGIHLFVIPESHIPIEQGMDSMESRPMSSHNFGSTSMKAVPKSEQAQDNQVAKEYSLEPSRQSTNLSDNSRVTPTVKINWYQMVMGLWLSGIVVVSLFFIGTSIEMNKKIKKTSIIPSEKLKAMVDNSRKELHIKRPIAIYVIEDITTPALTVSWNSKLLFPAHMLETMEDEKVLFALRHELTHFKGRDHLVSLLLRLLEALYWFNPVVWIASKKIIMDMELACDSRVVKDMEKAEKAHYASTILEMFSGNKKPQFVLGMAMGGTRDIAEKRIRGIYTKGRTKPRVRLFVTVLSATLIFSCFTTACQPTPEKPTVIGKGDGKLEGIIENSNTVAPAESAEPYEAPSNLSYKLEGTHDFSVEIDASVVTPDTNAYPVMASQRDTITQEQADKMIKALLQGKTLYKPRPEHNRALIQFSIDRYQKELEASDTQELKDTYKGFLKELMEEYDAAPESVELEPAQTEFAFMEDFPQLVDYYGKEIEVEIEGEESGFGYKSVWTEEGRKKAQADGQQAIYGVTAFELGGRQMELRIKKSNDNLDNYVSFVEYDDTSIMHPYRCADEMTLDQATVKAEQLIEDMGLDFSLVMAEGHGNPEVKPEESEEPWANQSWYDFVFKRRINGVSQSAVGSARIFNEVDYSYPYRGEVIHLTLDNYGIIAFQWEDPSKLVGTESANVPLLPFDEVKEIFDKQILIQNQWSYPDEDIISRRLVIDHVELSYMPIRKANDHDTYIYVPVWDFCGKLIAKYGEDYPAATPDHFILDENNERMEIGSTEEIDQGPLSFLTINAIDGSVIDRNRGY